VELEEWIRGMENIFAVIEVLKEKKVNIETFYLTEEADIWCSIVKDMLLGPYTLNIVHFKRIVTKFYPIMIQRQNEKKFVELKMSGNMTVMQYASKFTELSQFVFKFLASERMKMRRFEEGLAL